MPTGTTGTAAKEKKAEFSGGNQTDRLTLGLPWDPTRLAGCGFRPLSVSADQVDTRSEGVVTKTVRRTPVGEDT